MGWTREAEIQNRLVAGREMEWVKKADLLRKRGRGIRNCDYT